MATKKKRVYELAKEYGMTGQALATKLKELGITEVKGHMTALDEFQLLKVQGTLEANGFSPEASADTSVLQSDGLTVKKRKKKKKVTPADFVDEPSADPAPTPAPAPTPTPVEEPVAAEEVDPAPALPIEPVAEQDPLPAPPVPPAGLAPEPEIEPEPAPDAVPEPETEVVAEEAPATEAPPVEAVTAAIEAVEAGDEPAQEPEAAEAAPAPEETEEQPAAAPEAEATPAAKAEAAAEEAKPGIVKPGAKRRPGKVVGFVDLSKVQSNTAPRRPESRRLRSKDDVAPDVQPTLGHDRKRALMRGDHASRGQLSAAQLREKESGRFLRRRSQQQAQQRGGGGRVKSDTSGSPLAGGEVKIETPVTIKKLAEAISVKASQVVGKAFTSLGMMGININSVLDEDTAGALGLEYQVTIKVVHEEKAEDALLAELVRKRTEVEEHDLVVRPPTVAFLGHVDHGKTTLLDAIRSSRVVQGESGGITQHLGAYQIQTKSGHTLTVIDTPGHEAFTAMRLRGAQAVDIVVLVVAADDGVMPSTIEAINHAKAAGTPIVVAINKMDKPEANAGKVKQQLTGYELLSEEYGGETAMIEVSALKGTGIDDMLERVFLESEVLELKSHSKGPASGVVLEAEVQEGKGRVAYLLVKDGTLNRGDIILAGEGYGRVRSLHDDRSKTVVQAGPSVPVEVSGLSELPSCGDEFHVVTELDKARAVADERSREKREMSLAERRRVTNENLLQAVAEQQKEMINIILKADVQGSLQALEQQLESLTHDEVEVRVLHAALGTVTESDVNLAIPSGARVFAFRVGVHDKGRVAAERGGIEILHYDVIYELLDVIHAIMEGQLAPEMNEEITGHVEVRRVFASSKFGNIAGSYVLDGEITRDSQVRITRGGELVHTGAVASLRREKDDVKKVRENYECGVLIKNFDGYEEGDVIEAFKMVAVKRLLKI